MEPTPRLRHLVLHLGQARSLYNNGLSMIVLVGEAFTGAYAVIFPS
jgi:hypothetical protein